MRGIWKISISKTYFKMIATITIATLFLNLALIQFLYKKFEEIGLGNAHEFNRTLNSQLTYNFDYMNEIVRNMAITQFFDPANVQIMQSTIETEEKFNTIRNLTKLQDVIANNALLHSAVLYNNKKKEFYTIDSTGATPTQAELKDMVRRGHDIPNLSPIPGLLGEGAAQALVFTYVLYEAIDAEGVMDGAIFLNVKMEWLSNNLKKFMKDQSNFVLVDSQNNVLMDAGNEYGFRDRIPVALINAEINQSTIVHAPNRKQVVTKLPVPNTEQWQLICVSSYQAVFGFIAELKRQTFLVACSAFIIAILVSLALSRLIYRPFGILVQKVRRTMGDLGPAVYDDDTEYLSNALQSSIARYREISSTTKELIKENVFKSLLTESQFLQSKLYAEQLDELRQLFHSRSLKLIVFVIDQNKHYRSLGQSEKHLVKFSILNIASEVIGEFGCFEKAYIGNGEFVYLIDDSNTIGNPEEMDERIKTIQSTVVRITRAITISSIISRPFEEIDDVYKVYGKTRTLLNYRLSRGNSSILHEDDTGLEKDADDKQSIEAEARIIDAIKRGRIDEARFAYKSLADDLQNSHNNHLIVTMVRLTLSIGRTVQEINVNKMEEMKMDFNGLNGEIVRAETLDEINEKFQRLFEQIEGLQKNPTETRHQVMIDSVLDYVQLHYAEPDLSLKQIAAEFKMSQGYLGQLFREACNKSVGKHINDVRMEKVLYLLRSTDWSVRDIAVKSGYLNEANFYKVFKKEFGVTPNEYRMSKMLAGRNPAN